MSDAPGQLSDGFHFLHLPDLILDRSSLGQVAGDFGKSQVVAVLVMNGIDDDTRRETFAPLALAPAIDGESAHATGGSKRLIGHPVPTIFFGGIDQVVRLTPVHSASRSSMSR